MRFEVGRYSITVVPDSKQDVAYIEDTLGLKRGGQAIRLVRKDAFELGSIAYLETLSLPNQEDQFKSKPLTNLPGEETVIIPCKNYD